MSKDTLQNIATGVLCLCALVITGLLVKRELKPSTPSVVSRTSVVSNWKDFARGEALTSAGKPVTVVVFSDYQCPYCRVLAARIDSLSAKSRSMISLIYRNAPIPAHRFARSAAFAAECAGQAGKFERAHRLLFRDVDSIGVRSWGRFAELVNVKDSAAFSACVRDSVPVTTIRGDEQDAKRLSIHGTPTLLINEELVQGAPTTDELTALIAKHGRAVEAGQ